MRINPEFFRGKKVLVTGHTGFKGAWLTRLLCNWGASVIGAALAPPTTPNLYSILELENKIKGYTLDVRDYQSLKSVILGERPEIVFHLAAQAIVRVSYDDPLHTFSVNALGTANILEAIKAADCVKSAVIVTTDKVYENKEADYLYEETDALGGHDPYSASKATAEILVQSYGRSFFNNADFNRQQPTLIASARAGNVIGGGDWGQDRLVPDIVRAVYEKNNKASIRNPLSIRPWQHVLEPLSGYLVLAQELYKGNRKLVGSWNFGPDKESFFKVEDVLRLASGFFDRLCYEVKPDASKYEAAILMLNNAKAKKLLGWHPKYSIKEAVLTTLSWYKNYYEHAGSIIEFTDKQINSFFSAN